MADPDWNGGNYYDGKPPARGLAVARMVGHITYMSDESMREKFGRRRRAPDQFEVESYLRYRGNQFVDRFDANSYLYITNAMDDFDLTQRGALPTLFEQARDALPGDQLQFGLAVSQLSVAGDRERAAQPQRRRGLLRSGVELRARFVPGGSGASRPSWCAASWPAPTARSRPVREVYGRRDFAIIGEFVEPGTRVLDLGLRRRRIAGVAEGAQEREGRGVELTGRACPEGHRPRRVGVSGRYRIRRVGLSRPGFRLCDPVARRCRKRAILCWCCGGCCASAGGPSSRSRISATVPCGGPRFAAGARLRPSLFPYDWWDSPNIHFFTVLDFEALAKKERWRVERRIFLAGQRQISFLPNLMAAIAVFLVTDDASKG